MAVRYATKAGNWNDPTVWDDGIGPVSGDTVQARGFIVTITASVNIGAGTLDTTYAGTTGYFRVTNATGGIDITANVLAGLTNCLQYSHTSGTCVLTGNVTGGSAASCHGVLNSSTGTLTIHGNVVGGSNASATGVRNSTTGTLNVVGTVTGGTAGTGVYNVGAGTTNITGNVYGKGAYGATNLAGGAMNITGDCYGSDTTASQGGVINNGSGVLTVTGNAWGGTQTSAHGVYNGGTATATISGTATGGTGNGANGATNTGGACTLTAYNAVGNDYGAGGSMANQAVGVYGGNTTGILTKVRRLTFGPHGMCPVTGAVLLDYAAADNVCSLRKSGDLSVVKLGLLPAENTVLAPTGYGDAQVGTLRLPGPTIGGHVVRRV